MRWRSARPASPAAFPSASAVSRNGKGVPVLDRIALFALVPAVALLGVSPAIAADGFDPTEDPRSEAEGSGEDGDDDIVVTGRAEVPAISSGALGNRSALDTPFSVNTATAEDIEKLRAHSIADYFVGDAAVTRDGGSRYNIHAQWVTVRGAAVRTQLYNGTPIGSTQGADTPPEFLQEVQLLKGAGGFIYGFGVPGGIINYITKKPTDDLLRVTLGYQSASLFRQHVDVSETFGGFGARLNLVQEFGETYNHGKFLRRGVALALRAELAPGLVWQAEGFYNNNRIDRAEPSFVVGGNASPVVPTYQDREVPDPVSGRTRFASDDTYTDGRLYNVSTGVTWDLAPGWQARVSYGRSSNNQRLPYERIMLINRAGDYGLRLFDGLNINENNLALAYLDGSFSTGGIKHQVTAGVDWRDGVTVGAQNLATIQAGSNLFNPVPARWQYDKSRNIETRRTGWEQEKSAFISDTVTVFDTVSLLAGLRYTAYEAKAWNWLSRALTNDYKSDGATPTFALLVKPDSGSTYYASYIEALGAGTIVGNAYENFGDILPALKSKQYEIGAKWSRASWEASIAAFRLDRGANLVTADNRLVQDGVERFQGVEAAARIRPSEQLSFGASGAFVDGKHHRATNGWLIGKPVHGTARWTGVVDVDYRPEFLPGFGFRGLVRYQGKAAIYNNQAQDWTVYTPDVVLANVGGDYRFDVGGRELTLRWQVQNLFDTSYWNSGTATCCYSLSPGQPRTFSLDLSIDL